ncbi:hypothetical protein BUALT_Bualt07G0151700 [Buddleja alternifolia]|uniref:DNA-directed RNA polymerase III subunit n=1 Tax=Buddleja alternifolia TaxID=168488 RepID=A0AAV6XLG6_9LAMI|nr:hypothetical protein BUALT_Bualt07G0151700 [Buddleja alternifolia]
MSFRGRGRGRGGFGGGFRPAKQVPFELFPEIEDLGTAKYSTENIQLIKWSASLQKYWTSSPYYYEDRSERPEKAEKPDIERYSDRNLQATKAKPPLWHFIKLDQDHVPAELARGEKNEKRVVKRVRWNPDTDLQKLDLFEKLEQKHKGQEGNEKKENEEEEEEEDGGNEEDEGEFSDEGDYEQVHYILLCLHTHL